MPKSHRVLLPLIVLTFAALATYVNCQNDNERSLSTSIAGMEMLLETEHQLLLNMENYANALQNKLQIIKSALLKLIVENDKARTDSEKYLANPLNGFSLIRRLHDDWVNWELYLKSPVGEVELEMIRKHRVELPTDTDLEEATSAIYRVQTTYDLKPAELSTGLINGKQYNSKLSALDCYTIGYQLLKEQKFYHAGFWLYTSLESFKDSDSTNSVLQFNRVKILQVYAEVILKQNRFKDALDLINIALTHSPLNAQLIRTKLEIELLLKTSKEKPGRTDLLPNAYERCCRGEYLNQPSKLHCRYNSTTSAFLKLAPLKMEEVHLDPYMVLYHDVISDAEIANLKELAKPVLKRATIFDDKQKRSVVVNRRTSKFSWFPDLTNDVLIRLTRRISDMTGFDLNGSEMLQVMNYGLGGHYETHYDFFNVSATTDVVRLQGDRISTVLFYMTDVEQGGATVFPHLQTAVFPRKGTAVIWYNLNDRGVPDWRTLHAACPVIVGSKWVSNKWVRERSQVFSRPCNK